MKVPVRLSLKRISAADGMATVEFAIILSVFLMMLLGIIEFGYDWYLKHALTNASRDGARYGVMYKTNTTTNLQIYPSGLPSGNWSTIETVVKNELNGELPSAIASDRSGDLFRSRLDLGDSESGRSTHGHSDRHQGLVRPGRFDTQLK